MSKQTAPSSLASAGRAFWRDIVGTYDLRADELRTLEDACGATDMLADLMAAWVELGRPFITKGSMGQEVEHPLIGSIDKQRKARQAFIKQLKLPDEVGADPRVNAQREGGNARWANAHGKGA